MKALAAVLAAALTADGGTPDGADAGRWADPIYRACPANDMPLAEPVDGGWFIPDARARRMACLLEACESERAAAKDDRAPPPVVIIAVVIGLVTGLGIGISGAVLLTKK